MRRLALPALLLAAFLVPASFVLATLANERDREATDRVLAHEAAQQRSALEAYFARARAVSLITVQNPAFRTIDRAPGSVPQRLDNGGRALDEANDALLYVERLYPTSIGEVCFIDRSGHEFARAVRGVRAPRDGLSPEEYKTPFFAPSFALKPGEVHQARPYVSPDTDEWVVANVTQVPGRKKARSIVHFEVTIESFRRAMTTRRGVHLRVVDATSGAVVIDGARPQALDAPLGAPRDKTYAGLKATRDNAGRTDADGHSAAYARVKRGQGNANDWLVVATSDTPAGSFLSGFGAGPIGMLFAALLLAAFAIASRRVGTLNVAARTDDLTGLPNRRAFLQELERTVARTTAAGPPSALLMIDLDRFKELNDTLGHHAGDALLRLIGPRIAGALRAGDMIARLGGDEFAIVIEDVESRAEVEAAADRIHGVLREPFAIEGMDVHIDASIGIALCPTHADSPTDLLQRADVAMYEAKEQRSQWEVYDPERDMHTRDRLQLLGDLRRALTTDELELYYQPKSSLADRGVTGVEALVRWRHPERGMLGPHEFLPLAEQTGLLHALTLRVLDLAIAQCASWRTMGLELPVAVNVSPADLVDTRFPDRLAEALTAHGVPGSMLQLEITENAIIRDPERVLDVLARVSEQGVGLSLDDFGTGWSSLGHLKRLPVQELKIDRSFVMNMEDDDENATIVRSTIELARNLSLKVVAEGVETEGAWAALAALGCDTAQGYLLSRPMPPAEIAAWVEQWRAASVPTPR